MVYYILINYLPLRLLPKSLSSPLPLPTMRRVRSRQYCELVPKWPHSFCLNRWGCDWSGGRIRACLTCSMRTHWMRCCCFWKNPHEVFWDRSRWVCSCADVVIEFWFRLGDWRGVLPLQLTYKFDRAVAKMANFGFLCFWGRHWGRVGGMRIHSCRNKEEVIFLLWDII